MQIQITIPELTVSIEIDNIRFRKGTTSGSGPDPTDLSYELGQFTINDVVLPDKLAGYLIEDCIDREILEDKIMEVEN